MTLKSILSLAVAALVSTTISAITVSQTLAQEPDDVQTKPIRAVKRSLQQISMTIGKGGLYETSLPYAKVSVADDKIVEVTPQSDRTFIFNPKSVGSTNVFIFDTKNMLIATLDVDVSSGATQTRETGGEVTIYGRIYDKEGALAKPARYQCGVTNCEVATDALGAEPSPAATPTTGSQGAATINTTINGKTINNAP